MEDQRRVGLVSSVGVEVMNIFLYFAAAAGLFLAGGEYHSTAMQAIGSMSGAALFGGSVIWLALSGD